MNSINIRLEYWRTEIISYIKLHKRKFNWECRYFKCQYWLRNLKLDIAYFNKIDRNLDQYQLIILSNRKWFYLKKISYSNDKLMIYISTKAHNTHSSYPCKLLDNGHVIFASCQITASTRSMSSFNYVGPIMDMFYNELL